MAGSGNRIMMSGDSPTPHSELIFELKEIPIGPPINVKKMVDKGIQFSPDQLDETTSTGTVHQTLAAQELNHSFQIQHGAPNRPTQNRRSLENEEAIEHIDDVPSTLQAHTKSSDKIEGEISQESDKTDGLWPTEEHPKPDEGCGIQCLYYTMQCCECTIL